MSTKPIFCVVGAGHGGLAMAGCLGLQGYEVRLLNRSPRRIEAVHELGGIEISGARTGFGPIAYAGTDPAEALPGADVVLVVVPASGHRTVAGLCAPWLTDGQIVVLNPGRTLGAVDFQRTLERHGARADLTMAEAQTFVYASRVCGPAAAHVFGVKNAVPLASLEPGRVTECLRVLQPALPQFVPASNVLKTSMDNIGGIFHPALVLLNSGWIEAGSGFELYRQGASPTVAKLLERLDNERLQVASALQVGAISARRWLSEAYGAGGPTLRDAMHANPGYRGIEAPHCTDMRYITEDVPFSLVPMSSLGRHVGVKTPAMDAVITLAGTVHERNYRAEGRTLESMGLDLLDLQQLRGCPVARPSRPCRRIRDGSSSQVLVRRRPAQQHAKRRTASGFW